MKRRKKFKTPKKIEDITTDTEEVKRIMGGYFAQFFANKLEHLNEMGTFYRGI